jgi:Tol biopolymer transport system component
MHRELQGTNLLPPGIPNLTSFASLSDDASCGLVSARGTRRTGPGAARLASGDGWIRIGRHAMRLVTSWPAMLAVVCLLGAGTAGAQVEGTDCGCPLTGAYVSPDPGVPPVSGAVSPGGAFRVEGGALPGPITVVRQSNGATVLQAQAASWRWSPDDNRIVIALVSGTVPNQLQQYWLFDLDAASPATPIWQASSTLWGPTRLRFSEDGAVFLFAGIAFNTQVQLTLLEIASGARFDTTFSFASPPSRFDDDSDPSVAGWGFGPDPGRFVYAWRSTAGPDLYTVALADVRAEQGSGRELNNPSAKWAFSPCGDVFGLVLKQDFFLDPVDALLFATREPNLLAAPLGQEGFPFDTVALGTDASTHFGLLGGVETPIIDNTADDACTVANQPPVAAFDPPAAPVAGTPGAFTDTSSDPDGAIVAWSWDFGDGGSSTAQSPSHVFAAPGRYTVRLTVTDDRGAESSAENVLVVCGSTAAPAGKLLYGVGAGGSGGSINYDLFAHDATSGADVQLTDSDWCRQAGTCFIQFNGSGTQFAARWSPDGSRIAFAPGGYFENGIWVMDADGRNRRRLTDGGGSSGDFAYHDLPVWSSDGQWIAFKDSKPAASGGDPGVYLIRPDGTGLTKIPGTTRFDVAWDAHPSFASPACAVLAPTARGPGCYTFLHVNDPRTSTSQPFLGTIREIRGDGSGLRMLVADLGIYGSPRYSPDATRIAYDRYLGLGLGRQVYVLSLDTPEPAQPLTSEASPANEYPVWSPDGLSIAYRRDAGGGGFRDVYVSDFVGCSSSVLRGRPGVQELPFDWRPGTPVAGPVSVSGWVYEGGSILNYQGGVEVSITGDATASVTTSPDGRFVIDGLPRDGRFQIGVSAAPGHLFEPPVPIELGGSVANVVLGILTAQVNLQGTVRFQGAPLAGVVIRAEGPGGPFEATTDEEGRFTLSVLRDQTYTLSGQKPGYRLEPAQWTLWVGSGGDLDLVAVEAPPAGRIAFTSQRDGNDEIYTADLDGSNLVNLTDHPAADVEPAWSPDGSRIAFASDRSGVFELFVMNEDGSEPTALFVEGRDPAWSPDGQSLVFASPGGLLRIDLASQTLATLTTDPTDRRPRWRRGDPPRVVFDREVAPDDREVLEVLLSDPPIEAVVLSRGAGFDGDFADRPTGEGITYATDDGFPEETPHVRVEIPSEALYVGLYAGRNPSWSPDGERVIADDDNGNLWWTVKDASETRRFVTSSGTDRDPDWRPDGVPACGNGVDDDGDGAADFPADPGCADAVDPDERNPAFACDNGLDDDGDGLVDLEDPGCPFPFGSPEDPPCDNGLDDDGDGLTDLDDPTCASGWPYWEAAPSCGVGGEAVLLYAALRALRRRQRQPSTS